MHDRLINLLRSDASNDSNLLEQVKKILSEKDPNLDLNLRDEDGRTALMLAVDCENPDIVKLLLAENANLDLQDKNGQTALILAVIGGNQDIVKLLLEEGANLDLKDEWGMTALMWAVYCENRAIVKLLLDKLNYRSSFWVTAVFGTGLGLWYKFKNSSVVLNVLGKYNSLVTGIIIALVVLSGLNLIKKGLKVKHVSADLSSDEINKPKFVFNTMVFPVNYLIQNELSKEFCNN